MSNEINVGAISEALNNKVDLNQLNTNAQGLEYVSGLSMPSGRYVDLTLGSSGTQYVAPANGWYYLSRNTTANNQAVALYLYNESDVEIAGSKSMTPISGPYVAVTIPIKKGQKCRVSYDASGDSYKFRFIYAQGEQ